VCGEIARLGPAATSHFRVGLSRLGSTVILSVLREADEKPTEFRQMRLSGIEEVAVAAPRIARSVVLDVSIEETQKVNNLVGEETRTPKTKSGSTHFALGLFTLFGPLNDGGVHNGAGVDLDVHHETGDGKWEIGGGLRLAGGGSGGENAVFFAMSVGGKYFTNDGDVSPYIGGGMAWSIMSLQTADGSFDGNGNGIGAYAEAGVELLRTHHAHLAFGARLDLPFYTLGTNSYVESNVAYSPGGVPTYTTYTSKYYYAPVQIEARLTF
jgi:hypothetical protein